MIMIMMSLPSFGSSSQASVTILEDFQMDTWSMGPNVPYPVHAAMTATTVGKYIYVCGGIYMQAAKNPTNPSNPANCARFDPTAHAWNANIASLPLAVDSASSATDGSRLFIFGGRQAGRRYSK
jgi:N-acetylneuraminic acid mutarotase